MGAERVLVDTSVWIDALRGGSALEQLRPLMLTGRRDSWAPRFGAGASRLAPWT